MSLFRTCARCVLHNVSRAAPAPHQGVTCPGSLRLWSSASSQQARGSYSEFRGPRAHSTHTHTHMHTRTHSRTHRHTHSYTQIRKLTVHNKCTHHGLSLTRTCLIYLQSPCLLPCSCPVLSLAALLTGSTNAAFGRCVCSIFVDACN